MTETSHMQQPANNIQGMFTTDPVSGPAAESHVESQRAMDPHSSLEDYNRTMLEHTQRQMSSFVDLDDGQNSGSSGRSSQSSGNSATSNGSIGRRVHGPPPTSASAQHQAMKRTGQLPDGSPN